MWAKQSTAATLIIGPILDSTGAEYTSAVIGDISISKNGGTLTALASAATLTHIANGQYTLVLTTGNTDTLGRAQFTCNKSTYQMPPVSLMIQPAMVFDSLVLGTDYLQADAIQMNSVALATPGASGGILISGSNSGTTTLGALTITGTTTHTGNVVFSDGITVSAPSTSNRAGISIAGNGTGAGLIATGGATGHGFQGVGGATSGNGMRLSGTAGNSIGFVILGQGSGAGMNATGGATGPGVTFVGGATSGNSIVQSVTSGNAYIEANAAYGGGTAWNSGAIKTTTFTAGAIDAAAIANGAIDAATFAADVDAEFLSYIVDDATRIDASALNTATATSIPAILDDTGTAGVVVASGSKTGYSLTAGTGLGNQTADITGNLSGSVGSVTGAINTAAGTITTLDALDTAQDTQHGTTQAYLSTNLGSHGANATEAGGTGDQFTALKLSSTGVREIWTDDWFEITFLNTTPGGYLQALDTANDTTSASLSAIDLWVKRNAVILSGLVTGAGTGTEVFTISTLSITATVTVDGDGNRSDLVWS